MSSGKMIPDNGHNIPYQSSYIMIFLIFCLTACKGLDLYNSCEGSYPIADSGIPTYFESLWPKPGAVISQRCYRLFNDEKYDLYNGIGVWILVGQVDVIPIDPTTALLPERMDLYLDGNLVPREYLEIGSTLVDHFYVDEQGNEIPLGPGSYLMIWTPKLEPGKHDARLEITRNTGETLEYSWDFYIANVNIMILTIIGLIILGLSAALYIYYTHSRRLRLRAAPIQADIQ